MTSLVFLGILAAAEVERYAFSELHMGGEVSVVVYAESSATADRAARAAYRRFEELEQAMSDYRAESEIRLAQEKSVGRWVVVSRDLFTVLRQGQDVAEATGGAFDVTAGPYVALWRAARQTGRMPLYVDLTAARERVGWRSLTLDGRRRAMRIAREGVKVDLGGIAKGYACDEALAAIRREGVRSAAVVAGGDMKLGDAPPGERGWAVRVAGEESARLMANVAVSTSGDTEQFVEIRGVRYSHIVDPRSGFGVSERIQATVVGRRGLDTDPWATALCVLGEDGADLAQQKGLTVWLVKRGE